MSEIREVSAPPSATGNANHTMSDEGKARLAALSATGQLPREAAPATREYAIPSEAGRALRQQMDDARTPEQIAKERANAKVVWQKPDAPPTVTDPDTGDKLNLLDGTKEPGTPPAAPTYDLIVDEAILPREILPEARQFAVDVAAIGEANGIPVERAQAAFSAAADLYAQDHELRISNSDQAVHILNARYGDKAATIIADAQVMTRHLGPDFASWADSTGAGDSPAALMVLHMLKTGDLHLTPSQAAEQIKKIRASKDGTSKYNIARAAVLARIANPAKADPSSPAYFSVSPSSHPVSTVSPLTTGRETQSREAQLNEINMNPDLYSSDATRRKPLIARRARLQAAVAAKKRSK